MDSDTNGAGASQGVSADSSRLLRHTLLCLSVTPGAVLFALQLLDHAEDPAYRKESAEGWVRLTIPKEQFEKEMGVSGQSITNYFRALEKVGFVRRQKKGGTTFDSYVRVLSLFLSDTTPELRTHFEDRFGYALDKVSYHHSFLGPRGKENFDRSGRDKNSLDPLNTEGTTHFSNILNETGGVTAATPGEPVGEEIDSLPFHEWLEAHAKESGMAMFGKDHTLMQTIMQARQKTEDARERNKNKPKSQRLRAKPKAAEKPKVPFHHQPHGMVTRFNERVAEMGLIPEPVAGKTRSQAKKLIAQFGADTAWEILEYLSSMQGWSKVRSALWQFKDEPIPTVGKALQLGAQVLNVVKETAAPKRSGGAKEYKADEDLDLDFG